MCDVPYELESVKTRLLKQFDESLDSLLKEVLEESTSVRTAELKTWRLVLSLARNVMSTLVTLLCAKAMVADIQRRGLTAQQVQARNGEDYERTMTTTFGPITAELCAYRDHSGAAVVTRVPARDEVLPLYSRCRSSELCLEWECRLGSDHPFRTAQDLLTYFSHGAVELEDTTISAHMLSVSDLIGREWLYREPSQIRVEIVRVFLVDREPPLVRPAAEPPPLVNKGGTQCGCAACMFGDSVVNVSGDSSRVLG
jgi:hypothetical protein